MRGYRVELRDEHGNKLGGAFLERLRPGETIRIPAEGAAAAALYRPTGDCAGVYDLRENTGL